MKILLERTMTNTVELIKIHALVMSTECPLHLGNVELTIYVECYAIVMLPGAARNAKYSILVAQMRAVRRGGGRQVGAEEKLTQTYKEEMKTRTLLERCKTLSGKSMCV